MASPLRTKASAWRIEAMSIIRPSRVTAPWPCASASAMAAMNPQITKPMLASKCERPDLLPFPVLATPKLDGIRCLKVGGLSNKRIKLSRRGAGGLTSGRRARSLFAVRSAQQRGLRWIA